MSKVDDYGLPAEKANELTKGLNIVKSERELLIQEFNEVSILEITEENLPMFRDLRLKIVKNRTQGINKWHKATKDFFLTGGKFVDAIKRKENAINEGMEEKLMNAEKHFENLEIQRLSKLQNERVSLLSEFVEDAWTRDLSSMEQDVWESYLSTKKQAYNDRIAEEKRLEEERLEKIKAEKEEQERIKKENAKLNAEIERQEKILEKEREKAKKIADAEAKKQAKIQAEKDAEIKKAREEKEKLEAEIKAKRDTEIEAENKRKESERLAKIEAEKLAKAPIKEQLNKWVESFEINNSPIDNEVSSNIESKFSLFKIWALKEITNI